MLNTDNIKWTPEYKDCILIKSTIQARYIFML